jgi:hypothetical protein
MFLTVYVKMTPFVLSMFISLFDLSQESFLVIEESFMLLSHGFIICVVGWFYVCRMTQYLGFFLMNNA